MKRFPNIELMEEPVRVGSSFIKGYEQMMTRIPARV